MAPQKCSFFNSKEETQITQYIQISRYTATDTLKAAMKQEARNNWGELNHHYKT
jgi:hypothetical protein